MQSNYLTANKVLHMFRTLQYTNQQQAEGHKKNKDWHRQEMAQARANTWEMAADCIRDEFGITEHILEPTAEMHAEAASLTEEQLEQIIKGAGLVAMAREDDAFIERQEERRELDEERKARLNDIGI